MVVVDLTEEDAPGAISSQELDAWLRSTDVDREPLLDEKATAISVASKSSSTAHQHPEKKKKSRADLYNRRRSSLDYPTPSDCFGVDAHTILMAASEPSQMQDVGKQNHDDVDEHLINQSVSRLVSQHDVSDLTMCAMIDDISPDASSMQQKLRRSSHGSNDIMIQPDMTYQPVQRSNASPSTAFTTSKDITMEDCSDIVNMLRGAMDIEMNDIIGEDDHLSMNTSSPPSPHSPIATGYSRSVSLPQDSMLYQYPHDQEFQLQESHVFANPTNQGQQSPVAMSSITSPRMTTTSSSQDLIMAMEQSQKSQDTISSSIGNEQDLLASSLRRGSLDMKSKATKRSRGLLLGCLKHYPAIRASSKRSQQGPSLDRRASCGSQVTHNAHQNQVRRIHNHVGRNYYRRASASEAKDVGGYNDFKKHVFMGNFNGVGRKQDMMNDMLRSMIKDQNDTETSCLGSKEDIWMRPMMKQQMIPDPNDESAVKAELERLARETQLMSETMEGEERKKNKKNLPQGHQEGALINVSAPGSMRLPFNIGYS